jgi:hypothetical protein
VVAATRLQRHYFELFALLRDSVHKVIVPSIAILERSAQIFELTLFGCEFFGIRHDLALSLLNSGFSS